MTAGALDTPSTRPYLIRALHEWCTDCGFSPYMAVRVDDSVQVPLEYVNDDEIVLNVSYDATSGLELGNDYISFKARFGGVPRQVMVPVSHVLAIYARENGQGMGFPPPEVGSLSGRLAGQEEVGGGQESADESVDSEESERSTPSLRAVPTSPAAEDPASQSDDSPDGEGPSPTTPSGRPRLKLVK